MLFNSWGYMLFLLIAVPLHWLLPHRARLVLLSGLSILFYSMWRWEFSLLVVFSACVDYIAAHRIHRSHDEWRRKGWLLTSLTINLGLLIFFKYSYFIHDQVQLVGAATGNPIGDLGLRIVLPLGISFYTFQTISYTIDVYRRVIEPTRHFPAFLTYVTFWPQLIAGPILRAGEVVNQLTRERVRQPGDLCLGLELVLIGLFKKVVLADHIAPFVDDAFALDPALFSAFDVWVAAFLFGFQIYFDFSGYSDMAIGSARMLGIYFPANFNWPYMARSPKAFWQRWHISLSSWIRDYLYLPLTGRPFRTNSKGGIGMAAENKGRRSTTFALFVTWLIMGFWHGAGWTFALWGLYHAVLIYVYRNVTALDRIIDRAPPVAWAMTLLFSMAGWIPFRAQSIEQAFVLTGRILNPLAYNLVQRELNQDAYLFAFLLVLGMVTLYGAKILQERFHPLQWFAPAVRFLRTTVMTTLVLVYLQPVSQFIYFQF